MMNLTVVLSFLPATTPLLLFHIPLLIFLIQSYLLPSIQPLPFPPSLSLSLSPSHHLFLTILLRTLPPRAHFLLVSLSPLLFVSQTEYQGAARMGYRLCVCVCVCVCGKLSLRGCLHNPHKSPHPPFGLLGKHNGCLSSIPAADTEQIDPLAYLFKHSRSLCITSVSSS